MAPQQKYAVEAKDAFAALGEFTKQMMTLSTGAIVLMASFSDKFGGHAVHRTWVKFSIIAFVICTISSLSSMFVAVLATYGYNRQVNRRLDNIHSLVTAIAAFGLFAGLVGLCVFVCVNI